CRLCGDLDERSLRAELARLRSTLPSVEDVARVLAEHDRGPQGSIMDGDAVVECKCGEVFTGWGQADLHAARAVLALFAGRTEAEVKAEALREAAVDVIQDDQGTDEWYAGWLRDRAARIEGGGDRG